MFLQPCINLILHWVSTNYYLTREGAVFAPSFLLAHPKNWIYTDLYKKVYASLPEESKRTFVVVSPNGFYLHTSNAEIIKEIMSNHNAFVKPVHQYDAINLFGHNIVGTEGAEWKRHRKVWLTTRF